MSETPLPRCRVVPEPGAQAAFFVDGQERLRWHFGRDYPRPFFYPVLGPAGPSLTRMGHPGAPNHDHHRSVWFGHADVGGVDFWADQGAGRVRQDSWLCYEDGTEEAAMAVSLVWAVDETKPLLRHMLIASVRPLDRGEWTLELQSEFSAGDISVVLGQTNFGFLAVRVAKSLSAYFGGGKIVGSEGEEGEQRLFGKYARWMDYSGPVAKESGKDAARWNGITYFDHRNNPEYPAHWHVREDGWMGASLCRNASLEITPEKSLQLRYLLHVHEGPLNHERAESLALSFNERPNWRLLHRPSPHLEYALKRS